jgi:hypothetical protein
MDWFKMNWILVGNDSRFFAAICGIATFYSNFLDFLCDSEGRL